ncbi:hypothetical protein [Mesorhizobium sp. M2C.T.Ca.TU.002.02.1.1]|uniref:hypothetical protein n=1 Tax=Mesorhizobium sp. M2C.T.Ca.TU.002.02.1.1 TaxID=2496788 RepID=UPI000FCA0233|nr:hypothetical protein [Mesorhizobium sp. M2C.T.Ca.TU.002.02.1.1]RUU56244.1 hypothetical protein EOD07_16390 [Mesorhizobium sp. M2C.T.Ca.TU.002.02.1.1]
MKALAGSDEEGGDDREAGTCRHPILYRAAGAPASGCRVTDKPQKVLMREAMAEELELAVQKTA